MSAEAAVFTAAVARDEVRNSLNRLEYHLARGARGKLGVDREVGYLNALGRQSARLGNATAGGINVGAKAGLGEKAKQAMIAQGQGSSASSGRLKSSLLANYSEDTMSGAREWTYDGNQTWVWTANASACPACLANHGQTFTGPFVPMHPSCLCFPQELEAAGKAGVEQLSDKQLVDTLLASNNSVFVKAGVQVRSGLMSVEEAAALATRRSQFGLRAWAKTMEQQAARAEGILAVPDVAAPAAPAVPEAATIVDDVPSAADVIFAADAAEAQALLDKAAAAPLKVSDAYRVNYTRKAHEDIVKKAEVLFDEHVTDAGLRLKMAQAIEQLDEVATFEQKTSTTGAFSWRRGGHQENTKLRLNIKRQNGAEVDRWNAIVRTQNAEYKALMDDYAAGRVSTPEYYARKQTILANRANQDDYDLWVQATPDKVADTLVHEAFHAVDEASGFTYGAAARKDIQAEVRAIARSSDPQAKAFEYAAELDKAPAVRGVETAAEMVRMYFVGTGEQASAWNITPLSALEWRAKYPRLAKWVEEVVLNG